MAKMILGNRILAAAICFVMLTVALLGNANAADNVVTVAGTITFKADLKEFVMKERHGHGWIAKVPHGEDITNLFGVSTDVVIRSAANEIVGMAKTNPSGRFECIVPAGNFYTVTFVFNGKTITKIVSKEAATNLEFHFGRIRSDDLIS